MPRYRIHLEFRVGIIVEPDGKVFHAYSPALRGLHVYGDTKKEAIHNAADAATAYFESLIKHGDPIPVGVDIKRQIKEITSSAQRDLHFEDLTIACAI
jgi:antitoxin HicB